MQTLIENTYREGFLKQMTLNHYVFYLVTTDRLEVTGKILRIDY